MYMFAIISKAISKFKCKIDLLMILNLQAKYGTF